MEKMLGDGHDYLQAHPFGVTPSEAALGLHMLALAVRDLHKGGRLHK